MRASIATLVVVTAGAGAADRDDDIGLFVGKRAFKRTHEDHVRAMRRDATRDRQCRRIASGQRNDAHARLAHITRDTPTACSAATSAARSRSPARRSDLARRRIRAGREHALARRRCSRALRRRSRRRAAARRRCRCGIGAPASTHGGVERAHRRIGPGISHRFGAHRPSVDQRDRALRARRHRDRVRRQHTAFGIGERHVARLHGRASASPRARAPRRAASGWKCAATIHGPLWARACRRVKHALDVGRSGTSIAAMPDTTLDLRGLRCPLPALKTRKALTRLAAGDLLVVECTDPLSTLDIPNLINQTGDVLEDSENRARPVRIPHQEGRRMIPKMEPVFGQIMRLKENPMAHRCAILDDYQNVALKLADWSIPDVEVKVFNEPFADQKAAVAALKGFSIICMMRERTPFLKPTLEQLPDLKLLLTSGARNASIDLDYAAERGITVCGTGGGRPADRRARDRHHARARAQDRLREQPHEVRRAVAVDARHRAWRQDARPARLRQARLEGRRDRQGDRHEPDRLEREPHRREGDGRRRHAASPRRSCSASRISSRSISCSSAALARPRHRRRTSR